jgi:hypothetical protein
LLPAESQFVTVHVFTAVPATAPPASSTSIPATSIHAFEAAIESE